MPQNPWNLEACAHTPVWHQVEAQRTAASTAASLQAIRCTCTATTQEQTSPAQVVRLAPARRHCPPARWSAGQWTGPASDHTADQCALRRSQSSGRGCHAQGSGRVSRHAAPAQAKPRTEFPGGVRGERLVVVASADPPWTTNCSVSHSSGTGLPSWCTAGQVSSSAARAGDDLTKRLQQRSTSSTLQSQHFAPAAWLKRGSASDSPAAAPAQSQLAWQR